MARMTPCRSCGRMMLWARTRKGKWIPLNPEPDPGGNVAIHEGEVAEVMSQKRRREHGVLYRSHFATCPAASRHRRR